MGPSSQLPIHWIVILVAVLVVRNIPVSLAEIPANSDTARRPRNLQQAQYRNQHSNQKQTMDHHSENTDSRTVHTHPKTTVRQKHHNSKQTRDGKNLHSSTQQREHSGQKVGREGGETKHRSKHTDNRTNQHHTDRSPQPHDLDSNERKNTHDQWIQDQRPADRTKSAPREPSTRNSDARSKTLDRQSSNRSHRPNHEASTISREHDTYQQDHPRASSKTTTNKQDSTRSAHSTQHTRDSVHVAHKDVSGGNGHDDPTGDGDVDWTHNQSESPAFHKESRPRSSHSTPHTRDSMAAKEQPSRSNEHNSTGDGNLDWSTKLGANDSGEDSNKMIVVICSVAFLLIVALYQLRPH